MLFVGFEPFHEVTGVDQTIGERHEPAPAFAATDRGLQGGRAVPGRQHRRHASRHEPADQQPRLRAFARTVTALEDDQAALRSAPRGCHGLPSPCRPACCEPPHPPPTEPRARKDPVVFRFTVHDGRLALGCHHRRATLPPAEHGFPRGPPTRRAASRRIDDRRRNPTHRTAPERRVPPAPAFAPHGPPHRHAGSQWCRITRAATPTTRQ